MTVIAQTALHNNTFGFLLRHLLAVKNKLISPCQAKSLLFTSIPVDLQCLHQSAELQFSCLPPLKLELS